MESWRDMPGFEDYYEISDEGNARSKERRYRNKQGRMITKHSKNLKPIVGSNGYIRFGLKVPDDDKVYKVLAHRMVAAAFIPNTNSLPDVGHLNNDKGFNIKSNLYWTTKRDNIRKAVKDGNVTPEAVIKANSIGVELYKENETKEFKSITDAANYINCSVANIYSAITNGHLCCGYSAKKVGNEEIEVEMVDDVVDSSAVTAKRVAIEDGYGNIVVANSINSAAKKLNRAASSVVSDIKNNRKCNGFHVYHI